LLQRLRLVIARGDIRKIKFGDNHRHVVRVFDTIQTVNRPRQTRTGGLRRQFPARLGCSMI
jgi:hypothetical protein